MSSETAIKEKLSPASKSTALYPGTFDPITNGHMDIIQRGLKLCDEVVVAVSDHGRKNCMFGIDERVKLVEQACADMPNVRVVTYNNLLVRCAASVGATVIVRGLRVTSDFDYEFQMQRFITDGDPKLDVVYLMAGNDTMHISSSYIRELSKFGGNVAQYVPTVVNKALQEKMDHAS